MTSTTQADVARLIERTFDRVGSIETAVMDGDNLAVFLCSHFDDPDQDEEGDCGWTPAAIAGYEEVIGAIRDHFRPLSDTLAALSARLAEVGAENVRLQKENGIRQRRIERLEKLHRDIIAYQAGKAEQ